MMFKIIFTVVTLTEALLILDKIGEKRKPIEGSVAFINFILTIVFVYGLWNWL